MRDLPKYLEFTDRGNTRKKYLQELLLREQYNFLCYSRNLEMEGPKQGFNLEWGDTKEKVQLITQMLNELPDSRGGCVFYGRVQQWIESDKGVFVLFEVCSPERPITYSSIVQYFKITEHTYHEWVSKYEAELENRRHDDVPTILRAKVKKGCIYALEWEDMWS